MKSESLGSIAATFVTMKQRSAVLTEQVSEEGVFVRMDAPPSPMSLLRMELTLPTTGAKVELHGMVARVTPSRSSGAAGVEISFFAKGGAAGKEWDAFVTHARRAYPEAKERPVRLAREVAIRDAAPSGDAAGARPAELIEQLARGEGLFLAIAPSFALGSDVRVTLVAPSSGASFALDCVVRRRVFGSGGGVGVELTSFGDARRGELAAFLGALPAGEALAIDAKEIHAPRVHPVMSTLPGPVSQGTVRFQGAEDSWASMGSSMGSSGALGDG